AGILFVSQVVLARWMGRFEFGIYVYAWAWVGFLGMLSALGIGSSAQRFVPEYRSRGDLDHLRGFLLGSRLLCVGNGVAVGAIVAATLLVLGHRISNYYVVPFVLVSLTLPAFTLSTLQDPIARSFDWIALALAPVFILQPLIVIAVGSGLFLTGSAVTGQTALAIAAAAFWAVIIVQMVVLGRRLAREVPPGPRRYALAHWVRTALPLALVESFFVLLTYVDTLVLQAFVGPAEVAVYYAATKTLALVNFVYFAVSAASAHRFSEYHAARAHDELAAFLAQTIRWTFWPSLVLAALMIVLGKPILMLFGPGFGDGYHLILIMSVGLLARAAVGPAERLLNMIGQQNICAAIYGAAFALNLAMCLLLIPHLGLAGAAIATASAVLTESTLLFIVAKRRLGLHVFVWGVRSRG
ncbi:MAG: lipopolysaccharide biosynthesis protein, partial [Xanthobacteraceae bacterium]|nr:lipopolysaccharide biosynthesis protein [Xanthobacteraceae bacterium]